MNTRPQIAVVIVVAALMTVAAAGIGFAAPDGNTQAVTGPNTVQQQQAQVQVQQQQECTFPANESYESFDVSNLSAPSSAEPGATVMVTADISNPNDAPLIQCVEFRLEGDVVERRGWALNPNETETITFEVDTTGLEEGTYIHGVETRDMGELTTLNVSSEPAVEEPTASVEFNDQSSNGSEVIVSNASLSDGGFIAIHNESGAVIGASEYLEPGDSERIVVTLAEPLTANATLTAMPHLDTNDNQELDFITSEGAEDGPYTDNGTPVTDDANVTLEVEEPTTEEPTTEEPTTEEPTTEEPTTEEPTTEEPTTEEPTEEPTASVVFDDQSTSGVAVLIASANLSEGGFIVIHDEGGAVLGASGYLEPGESESIAVTLDEQLAENATLTAMAHVDSNDNQQLDYVPGGADDGPYIEGGDPVADNAGVTVESESE